MEATRAAIGRLVLSVIVVVVVIAGALALAAAYRLPPFQGASTSTVRTCTAVPAISYLYCPSPLRITAYGEPGATPVGNWTYQGTWNFTASISSDSVARGDQITLSANLTSIGSNFTVKQFVMPYINPGVYAANGTEVWAWNPPQASWPNVAIPTGETFSADVRIPTGQLVSGQSYFITVAPLSIQFPTPNNYTFTFQFSVH
jgi:hypothetical protein